MYLKSLTLKGFKSFADRTSMVFDPGLTVVVGPNGSGKSNISDAVLWVLGEQSAKMLRGQAMEDVIFSGSSARQPVSVAEVTLVLDNSDHTLPIDFAEVSITRRMFRSGESDYLINGAPSRLMDITDILHDSGLGKETHSIISQGKLDSILSSRPEERRELIEEAAGISKHRRRKIRSERKLRSMDENLTRAKDISREIARQLRPLERQVDKAKRHRELKGRLAELSTTLAVDDLRQLQARYNQLTARQREAEGATELASWRLEERKRELEKYQSLLEQKGIFVGDLGEQRRRMQDILARMDADMRLLEEKGKNMVSRLSEMRMQLSSGSRQRAEAETEHERVSSELVDATARIADLRGRLDELNPKAKQAAERRRKLGGRVAQLTGDQRAAQREADSETLAYAKLQDQISNAEVEDEMFASRLAQIDEQLATAEEAIAERTERKEAVAREREDAEARADAAQAAIAQATSELDQARAGERAARETLTSAEATLKALSEVDEQSANASELTARLAGTERDGAAAVRCRLADLIEVDEGYEALVEQLLGEDLAALVVADASAAGTLLDAALELAEVPGRATLLALDGARRDGREGPGDALLDHLRVSDEARAMVELLLGDVRLVGSNAELLAAHAENPGLSYVTLQGSLALADGRIVIGSSAGAEKGALARKRRIRALADGMAELKAAQEAAAEAVRVAEECLSQAREQSAQAKGEVARLRGELTSVTSELGRLEAQRTQASSERAQVAKRRAAAAERADVARPEIERHRAQARAAEERVRSLSSELEEALSERSAASKEESELSERIAELRLTLATVTERKNHLAVREEELASTVRSIDGRREQLVRSARALEVLLLRVDPLHDCYAAINERAQEWAARLRDRASLAEADSDSLKKTIAEARGSVDEASTALEKARGAANEIKVDIGRIEVQVENALTAITADGYILEEALELPEPEDREAMEREVAKLERQIASLGPVNEVAMDEYLRLKERADYIDEQVADLEAARKALTRITTAIERKMRRQFLVIFDAVNANFSEVFSMLFPGGHARLEMTDPDHLDETGIEIVAQPRGKKIQKMMLMSGGEKSLTALALLFAVYRTRTVPFYIFDEVEAALDDSNLGKLLDAIEQLKDTTQLIVISHQRRTMEQADVLYGVSMQADGVSHVVSQRLDRSTGKVVEA